MRWGVAYARATMSNLLRRLAFTSRTTFRLGALFCLSAGGAAISTAGCTPSPRVPLSGHVDLQYSNGSKTGLIFILENGVSEPIRLRGYGALPANTRPYKDYAR